MSVPVRHSVVYRKIPTPNFTANLFTNTESTTPQLQIVAPDLTGPILLKPVSSDPARRLSFDNSAGFSNKDISTSDDIPAVLATEQHSAVPRPKDVLQLKDARLGALSDIVPHSMLAGTMHSALIQPPTIGIAKRISAHARVFNCSIEDDNTLNVEAAALVVEPSVGPSNTRAPAFPAQQHSQIPNSKKPQNEGESKTTKSFLKDSAPMKGPTAVHASDVHKPSQLRFDQPHCRFIPASFQFPKTPDRVDAAKSQMSHEGLWMTPLARVTGTQESFPKFEPSAVEQPSPNDTVKGYKGTLPAPEFSDTTPLDTQVMIDMGTTISRSRPKRQVQTSAPIYRRDTTTKARNSMSTGSQRALLLATAAKKAQLDVIAVQTNSEKRPSRVSTPTSSVEEESERGASEEL